MAVITVTAAEARTNLGELISRVSYGGERVIVRRRDKPLAALVSIADLRLLEKLENERDAELLRLAKETSEGYVPFQAVLDQYKELFGEPLTPEAERE
jgi:prevent-host-death family protein